MRKRRTARVMLFDEVGEILLIRFVVPRDGGEFVFWALPGGEIEAGETEIEAAVREVREEVGLELTVTGPVYCDKNQFFHQGMAEDQEPRLLPQRALGDEKAVPVTCRERLPKRGRRIEHGAVFVEQRERVAQRPPRGADAGARDLSRLQPVQAALGLRALQPNEGVEEVVQVVARGNGAGAMDEGFVGLAGRQLVMRHEARQAR